MILSIAFVGEVVRTDSSMSASAQQTTVRRKRKPGVARRTYRGGRYVIRRTWDGTKWVSKRVWVGSKYVGRKTYRGGRKVVSRTKKIVY
jgi:hypothetical protein